MVPLSPGLGGIGIYTGTSPAFMPGDRPDGLLHYLRVDTNA